jgi:hypothetical protein
VQQAYFAPSEKSVFESSVILIMTQPLLLCLPRELLRERADL